MTLIETQRQMAAAVMEPLSRGSRSASFLKANSRLSSLERLEIYRRSYWARLLDSLREDFPGLEALLGSASFDRLATAYLTERPSCSFTLRDLGAHLAEWLAQHPEMVEKRFDVVLDMVRLECAHAVAFDGPVEKTLEPEHLAELNPAMRLGLQPYITLLELRYAVDEFRVAIQTNDQRAQTTSNLTSRKRPRTLSQKKRPQPGPVFVAVHRLDTVVYYRRLAREEFLLLKALQSGERLNTAIRLAFVGSPESAADVPELLRNWFSQWTQFSWLIVSPRKGRRP